jgi:hypothetical protein
MREVKRHWIPVCARSAVTALPPRHPAGEQDPVALHRVAAKGPGVVVVVVVVVFVSADALAEFYGDLRRGRSNGAW